MEITKQNIHLIIDGLNQIETQEEYDKFFYEAIEYIESATRWSNAYKSFIKSVLSRVKFIHPYHLDRLYQAKFETPINMISLLVGHVNATKDQIDYYYYNYVKGKMPQLYSKVATRPNTSDNVLEELYELKDYTVICSLLKGPHRSKFINRMEIRQLHPLINRQLIMERSNKYAVIENWDWLNKTLWSYDLKVQRLVVLSILQILEIPKNIVEEVFDKFLVNSPDHEEFGNYNDLFYEIIRARVLNENVSINEIIKLTKKIPIDSKLSKSIFKVIKSNYSSLSERLNAFHLEHIILLAKSNNDSTFAYILSQHPQFGKTATAILGNINEIDER